MEKRIEMISFTFSKQRVWIDFSSPLFRSPISLFFFFVYIRLCRLERMKRLERGGERDEGVVLFDCLRLVGERR